MPPPDDLAVPSAIATAGVGVSFEQQVGVFWLSLLLVRGIPPIAKDFRVEQVHLQARILGWATDDVLVTCRNGAGQVTLLAVQAKRSFTLSESDAECQATIRGMWQDFSDANRFSPVVDHLVLVVQQGTNTLLHDGAGLLDMARGCPDALEFDRRCAVPKFISNKSREQCDAVRAIIAVAAGRAMSRADIWPFLKVLHILSLDLCSSTDSTKAVILSLLASTAQGPDSVAVANATWNALLAEVAARSGSAPTIGYDALPQALRERHAPIGSQESLVLDTLAQHGQLILKDVRTDIGGRHRLARAALVHQVVDRLHHVQLVILRGAAGCGKSAIAKLALQAMSRHHVCWAFRAAEFARTTLDEVFHLVHLTMPALRVAGLLAGQGRKVMLIDSMERLLEKEERSAFADLLGLVAGDPTWTVILTCRDYSTVHLRSAFPTLDSLQCGEIDIPPLEGDEMAEVLGAFPDLGRPFSVPSVRRLLTNPYLLDMAAHMSWSGDAPLPDSERAFRARVWREVIRSDQRVRPGEAIRRGDVFMRIARFRAIALADEIPCTGFSHDERETIEALRRDSLVVPASPLSPTVAPAHDVLEDWAILAWLDEQIATVQGDIPAFCAVVGDHPALRRTYRTWIGDYVAGDPQRADAVVQAALTQGATPSHVRDATLIALLRSDQAASIIERQSAPLLANDCRELLRVIRLVMVACVRIKPTVAGFPNLPTTLTVPDGSVWPCLLQFIWNHRTEVISTHWSEVMAFIVLWWRGVTAETPYPEGYEAVAAIAHALLAGTDDGFSHDERWRLLQIIIEIPRGAADATIALIRGSDDDDARQRIADDARELIYVGTLGLPFARDCPTEAIAIAKDYLLQPESEYRVPSDDGSYAPVEGAFGIAAGRLASFHPASAFRGPYLALLLSHRRDTLQLIVDVCNVSVAWYHRYTMESLFFEPLMEIILTEGDGRTIRQWMNERHWLLYRGMSVGPEALSSLLMALERWLLRFAIECPDEVDAVLMDLVRASRSAAITAVVASVATAYPMRCPNTVCTLVSARECVMADRHRFARERLGYGLMVSMPDATASGRLFASDRAEAAQWPHRGRDLEWAAVLLQGGQQRVRIQEVLDRHRSAVPTAESRNDGDRTWLLALDRMDLRCHVADSLAATPSDVAGGGTGESPAVHIQSSTITIRDADVRAMVAEHQAERRPFDAHMALANWGNHVFDREPSDRGTSEQWRSMLAQAQLESQSPASSPETHDWYMGPALVAAVCVRDHWGDMNPQEQAWCANTVCEEIAHSGDRWEHVARCQRNAMSADRRCADVVAALVARQLPETLHAVVQRAVAIAVTHPIDEVRECAARGIGYHLLAPHRTVALRLMNAIAWNATLVAQALNPSAGTSDSRWRDHDSIEAEAAASVRHMLLIRADIPSTAFDGMSMADWSGSEATALILPMLRCCPRDPVTLLAFRRAATTLVAWWNDERSLRGPRHRVMIPYSRETAQRLEQELVQILFQVAEADVPTLMAPLLPMLHSTPLKLQWILRGILERGHVLPHAERCWTLWTMILGQLGRESWAHHASSHADQFEMLALIFLRPVWGSGPRWQALAGHEGDIDAFFASLPVTAVGVRCYIGYLAHLGARSRPAALLRIAAMLRGDASRSLLADPDSMQWCERMMQSSLATNTRALKSDQGMRDAVLQILDRMVEDGSSIGYQLREDFVTPSSPSSA